ncbi:MAG TPA: protein-glutamate O-methyltransferase CheR [Gemmatimonadales bacterium]|nr:protein-glutamate O-methyltransferase CheR [Gemmatimonadales bacterium]
MIPSQDPEFDALTRKISLARGISCESYKHKCFRRRLAVRMRARGVHTYGAYARLLDEDATEYDRLLDTLTINVTKFWRNAETWEALAVYLRELWHAREGRIRVWSAGCASGEEPYSLAVAIAETARHQGQERWLDRPRIDATDLDRESIARTESAAFPASAFGEIPGELAARYFSAVEPRQAVERLRTMMRVRRHDLTTEPPPAAPYDLIVCRNVMIYFERPLQERLFGAFADALVPAGILVLGKVETLFGEVRQRFKLEEPRERIYRRLE